MRITSRLCSILVLLGTFVLTIPPTSLVCAEGDGDGEGGEGNNDGGGNENNQNDNNDEGNDQANENNNNNNNNAQKNNDYNSWNAAEAEYVGDDYIKYWTGYAVLPKSCITLGGEDVVVFSVYENGYKQCSDRPMGTYYTPVPYFLQAYLQQVQSNQYDMGYEDYELPESSVYAECTYKQVNGEELYVMAGCDDMNKHQLAVNIYKDNTCEKSYYVNGMDDSNIDISDIQIPFQQCQACVTWLDKNDDEVDDQYYENKQINAPLCSQAWAHKSKCGPKCKRLSKEVGDFGTWQRSDVLLLSTLVIFSAGMLAAIVKKRRKMEEKESSLLADPTFISKQKSAAQWISEKQLFMSFGGVFACFLIFALFSLKKMTWLVIICLNLALFGYLLVLVIETAVSEGDDDDEDDDDEDDDDEDDDDDEEKPQLTNLPAFA